ncbi:cation efflux family protein [Actinidia rufa]|uniref:Cation efflux family protein n=1 Tax=Actinidia rufa TaxID=165716 RepID=A0A7J0FJ60_9ERIC|nr:cation efflux family protein [Actinidia rufa]
MGFFKIFNLNPLYRTYVSRFHRHNRIIQTLVGSSLSFQHDRFFESPNYKNLHIYPHNRIIQTLGSSQFFDHDPLYESHNHKIFKRWHVGGHSHHHSDRSSNDGEKVFRMGLAADIGLASGKAFTGYLTGSTAIIADAAHSISDVFVDSVGARSTPTNSRIRHLRLVDSIRLDFQAVARYYSHHDRIDLATAARRYSRWDSLPTLAWLPEKHSSVLSGVALLSFKAARVPKDKEHPYGHGKFETLGALGISVMLLGTAGGIAWHALDILLGLFSAAPEIVNQSLGHEQMHSHHHGGHSHGIDMDHPILALSMTIISISVKEGLYWITKRAGEREGSGLMKANAWHHRADAVSSFVALIGVGGSMLGVKFLDPLAGIVVSGMIFKAGLETGYQSLLELVDAAVPSQQLDLYKQTILQVEGVKVDPFSSVSAAHEVGENVRHQIQKLHPEVAEVFIHIGTEMVGITGSARDESGGGHSLLSSSDGKMGIASLLCMKKVGTAALECSSGYCVMCNMRSVVIAWVSQRRSSGCDGKRHVGWGVSMPNCLGGISGGNAQAVVKSPVGTLTNLRPLPPRLVSLGGHSGSFWAFHDLDTNPNGVKQVDPAISLFAASATDQGSVKETECQNRNLSSEHKDIEDTVSDIFSLKFSGKMVLERITPHLLGDKILLQIEVSMPPDILIRDAMKLAEEAEREILKAVPDAVQVCILLRLGHAIP